MARTTVSIPTELIPKLEQWGNLTAQIFSELRRSKVIVPDGVPEDQKSCWTKQWQKSENQADLEFANGDFEVFYSIEDLIAGLNS